MPRVVDVEPEARGRLWRWPRLASGSGVALAALGAVDPDVRKLALIGALLVLGGAWGRRGRHSLGAMLAVLGVSYAVLAFSQPELRADSGYYYGPLRSLAFDRDLDLANEFQTWGFPILPHTDTGQTTTTQPIGPALVWSPFFAAAHVYVLTRNALVGHRYSPDGYAPPYLRATALGSLTGLVLGGWLLWLTLRRRFGTGPSVLALCAAFVCSPSSTTRSSFPGWLMRWHAAPAVPWCGQWRACATRTRARAGCAWDWPRDCSEWCAGRESCWDCWRFHWRPASCGLAGGDSPSSQLRGALLWSPCFPSSPPGSSSTGRGSAIRTVPVTPWNRTYCSFTIGSTSSRPDRCYTTPSSPCSWSRDGTTTAG